MGSVHVHPLPNIKLNFVVLNYNPAKSEVFALRISEELGQVEKEVGEYLIDANNFIDTFTQTENGAFTLQVKLNEEYSADIEIYVEKSRYGVERLIRDVKNPKPKQKNEEDTKITHQKIVEQRKYLPLEDEEEIPHHKQKFSKFSPKREVAEEPVRREQFMNKVREEEKPRPAELPKKESPKKRQEPAPARPAKAPEPEKVDAVKTKTNSRDSSRVSETSETKLKNSSAKAKPPAKEEMKTSRVRKPAPEPTFLESLPINLKYLIPAVLLIIIGVVYASFSGEEKPQQPLFPKLEETKVGKEKVKKAKKAKK